MEPTDSSGVMACLIEMRFDTHETERAVRLLLSVVERTHAKKGCDACWVARDAVELDLIRYSEFWASDSRFASHVRSDEFRRVLVAMDLCCELPSVTVGKFLGRKGIDYLSELCNSLGSVRDQDA